MMSANGWLRALIFLPPYASRILPFRANAGTEVVTDVLFFENVKKRQPLCRIGWKQSDEDEACHECGSTTRSQPPPDWLIAGPTSQGRSTGRKNIRFLRWRAGSEGIA